MSKNMPADLGRTHVPPIATAAAGLPGGAIGQLKPKKRKVSVWKLKPYRDQPSSRHAAEAVEALKKSIRRLGLQDPPAVRKLPDGTMEILDGHRRIRAWQLLVLDGDASDKIHVFEFQLDDEKAAYYVAAEIGHSRDADAVHKAQLIGRASEFRAAQLGREPTVRDLEAVVEWQRSSIHKYLTVYRAMKDPRIRELVHRLDKPLLGNLYAAVKQDNAAERERLLRIYVEEGSAGVRRALAEHSEENTTDAGHKGNQGPVGPVSQRITAEGGYEYRIRVVEPMTSERAATALVEVEKVAADLRRIVDSDS